VRSVSADRSGGEYESEFRILSSAWVRARAVAGTDAVVVAVAVTLALIGGEAARGDSCGRSAENGDLGTVLLTGRAMLGRIGGAGEEWRGVIRGCEPGVTATTLATTGGFDMVEPAEAATEAGTELFSGTATTGRPLLSVKDPGVVKGNTGSGSTAGCGTTLGQDVSTDVPLLPVSTSVRL